MINGITLLAMGIAAVLAPVQSEVPQQYVTENSVYRAVVDRVEDNDFAVVEVCVDGEAWLVDVPTYQFNEPARKDLHMDVETYVAVMDQVTLNLDGELEYQFTPKDSGNVFKWSVTSGFLGFTPKIGGEYALVYSTNGTTDETDDIMLMAFPMEVK